VATQLDLALAEILAWGSAHPFIVRAMARSSYVQFVLYVSMAEVLGLLKRPSFDWTTFITELRIELENNRLF